MAQYSFDFTPPPCPETQNILKETDQHNQRVIAVACVPSLPSGSLLSAVDASETRLNAIYILRGVLNRQLRSALGNTQTAVSRKNFLRSLKAEIALKKTGQNVAGTVRHILIKSGFS